MIRFAALFDMDGTILKTETIVESAFEATFETLRHAGKWVGETPLDHYRSILGVTLEQVWIQVMPNASDEVRREADQLLLLYLIEELKNGHGELYEGVKETLTELSEMGIPLFVASNGLNHTSIQSSKLRDYILYFRIYIVLVVLVQSQKLNSYLSF